MAEWSQHLPGVEASDLSARQIPDIRRAPFYSDLAPGKGIVVVELQKEREEGKGLLSQISNLKGVAISTEDLIAQLKAEMKEMKGMEARVEALVEARIEGKYQADVVSLKEGYLKCMRRGEEQGRCIQDLKEKVEGLKQQNATLI